MSAEEEAPYDYDVVLRLSATDENLQSILQFVPPASIQATWRSAERRGKGLAAANLWIMTEDDWVALNRRLVKFLANSGSRLREIVELSSGVELDVGVFSGGYKAVRDIEPDVLQVLKELRITPRVSWYGAHDA